MGRELTLRDLTVGKFCPRDGQGKHKRNRSLQFLLCMTGAGFGTIRKGQKGQILFRLHDDLNEFCVQCLQ